jgi:SAM-dependent methyltransferase
MTIQNEVEAVSDIPLPPKELADLVGGGGNDDFTITGRSMFDLVTGRCQVRPTDDILDIGSGCGRVAVPFTRFLDGGSYRGFDVVEPMVAWCRDNISSRFPAFHFVHADLSNTLYSTTGADAAAYRFPYPDESFDVVFATSVFTHLLPASAHNYAREIRRVMKKDGGRGLLTFFLVNDEFRRQRTAGEAVMLPFPNEYGAYSTINTNVPEAVLAFEESYAREMLENAGLAIADYSYGYWRVPGGWTQQDVILVT